MFIGKIVKSDSHINYVCQIYGLHETGAQPNPADYAFGRFVRVVVRSGQSKSPDIALNQSLDNVREPITYAVGVIYDTILFNPAYGDLGPRLSNEAQVELFSPDYISEKAIMVYVMVLGMIELQQAYSTETHSVMQGVPLLSLELGSEIETMTDEEVRTFHVFHDGPNGPNNQQAYLHMGYLPHIIAQRSSLLPMVTLCIIDQLERLFPQHLSLLSIVKRNFAWRLKVETTG